MEVYNNVLHSAITLTWSGGVTTDKIIHILVYRSCVALYYNLPCVYMLFISVCDILFICHWSVAWVSTGNWFLFRPIAREGDDAAPLSDLQKSALLALLEGWRNKVQIVHVLGPKGQLPGSVRSHFLGTTSPQLILDLLFLHHPLRMLNTSPPCHFAPISKFANSKFTIDPGGHLYFRLDIILVKRLSKHTLNTYFSGMKIDPKYAVLQMRFSQFQWLAPTTKIKPFLDSLKKELSKNVYFYYGRVYSFQVVSF